MKSPLFLLFLLIPALAFGQLKAKRFTLPSGIEQYQYAQSHVLVKVKKEYVNSFQGSPAVLKNLSSSSIKPIVKEKMLSKTKSRMLSRLATPQVDMSRYFEIGFSGRDVETFINELYQTGYFEVVEPDYNGRLFYTPNDPQQASQYYLSKIKAYQAWDITKGSEDIVIAIVDSGGDLDHPDLVSQLFIDPNDPVDGFDNDNDGYIDNNRGWDFMGADTLNITLNNFQGDNDPSTLKGGLSSHGTAVAGCAAAATDNATGISGVGFKSKILFTKHSADNQGENRGGIYRGYEGILYAATHGAKIINCSWGGNFRSQIAQDIITHVTLDLGALVVAAAGNEDSATPGYPASYDHVLSVAATDQGDLKAWFSSYGKTVDLMAPGLGIFTTFYNNDYITIDGTSFSSPITAGAAALVWAHNPTFTPTQVAEQLRVTSDESAYAQNSTFYAKKLGKGRLDIFRALTKNFPSIRASNPKFVNATGDVAQPGQDGFLTMDFTNFLAASSAGLTITVQSAQTTLATISNGNINPGSIATNQTVNNKPNPVLMKINQNIGTNTTLDLIVTYSDGEYTDFQYLSFLVNPSFVDVDDNLIFTTLAGNGRIGFEDPSNQVNGSGFIFNDNKLLFEMGLIMGTPSTKLFNNVRGSGAVFDQDFSVSQKIQKIEPGERSYSEVFGAFTDNASSKTVSVNYRSLVWKEKPFDKFVVMEYKVKNISDQALNNFHFALFADWDITDQGGGDVAEWNAQQNMGYAHPAKADDKPYAGIKILKGIAPEYFAIDNDASTPGTPFGLYDGFTDAEKFQAISSGIGRSASGFSTPNGNDVSHVVGAGPYTIAPNEEVTITFALVAGINFSDLMNSAAQSDTAYNLMLTAEKPTVEEVVICKGSTAMLTATGSNQNFKWYQDFTGGEAFAVGKSFITDNLFRDTVFYVSNADNTYESVRTAAKVNVIGVPEILSSAGTSFCEGDEITLSVDPADQYLWNNGATTQSIQVTEAGDYFINVQHTSLGCNNDSENFSVTTNPLPVSQFTIDGDLTSLQQINFVNASTGGTNYVWDFGDGQKSTQQSPTHAYNLGNEYIITLTVENQFGCKSISTETISVVTSLEDQLSNFIQVSPNPFKENLTIQFPKGKIVWKIMDMKGRVMGAEMRNIDNMNMQQIQVQDLAPGVYVLKATDGTSTVSMKLIKVQ